MIVAVDFDGTLWDGKKVNEPLLLRLAAEQRRGNLVILWTCREGGSLKTALDILSRHGFRPSFVNQNAPAAVSMLGGNPRKIYADIYIDDKAVRP